MIGQLARYAEGPGVTYLWGNHDHDIALFKDLLRFDVYETLEIGDKVLVRHGYQYDPYIGPLLDQSHTYTRIHHVVERMFDTWIRLPLENFYTVPNRLAFWTFHKVALGLQLWSGVRRRLGNPEAGELTRQAARYWTHNQLGDPAGMFESVRSALAEGQHEWLVCGHSHLPGCVEVVPGRRYVNTGSWTFSSSQYAHWDGQRFEVR